MKNIVFKTLSIKNFLSIGSSPVNISFTPGVNLITGVNLDREDASNGSGKSSLINAVYFCLYGKTLKDLKLDQIPNSYTKGPCEVEITFEVVANKDKSQYKIRRSLRPSKLFLWENDVDITKSTMSQTSALIQEIINCTDSVFQKSIVMDANNATAFMAQKKVEKRKFLEGILNLEVFSDMLSIARTEFNEVKFECEKISAVLNEKQLTLNSYQEQEQLQRAQINQRKQRTLERIQELRANIVTFEKQAEEQKGLSSIEMLEEKQSVLKVKLREREDSSKASYTKKGEIDSALSSLKLELKALTGVTDLCNECRRPFTEQDKETALSRKDVVTSNIAKLNRSLESIKETIAEEKESIEKLSKALDHITVKITQRMRLEKTKEQLDWKIESSAELIQDLQKELNSIEVESTGYGELITRITQEIQVISQEVDKLQDHIEVLGAVKFVLSEEGVRSYIVKKVLQILNSRLNYYLKELDANTKGEFDEYFEESLEDQFGNARSYDNFSSGEQRRIDLAILFTFQDIRRLQADVNMNISIYDELLDSSLDKRGTELVMKILSEKAAKNNECVYIISHRKETQSTYITNTVSLQKQNGITTLAQ